jgi:hypothetical protein
VKPLLEVLAGVSFEGAAGCEPGMDCAKITTEQNTAQITITATAAGPAQSFDLFQSSLHLSILAHPFPWLRFTGIESAITIEVGDADRPFENSSS